MSAHHDLESERAVLACVLLENDSMDEIELDPLEFYGASNRVVWGAMLRLHRKRDPIDLITLRASIETMGDLERAGGDEKLVELTQLMPRVDAIEAYARRVQKLAVIRQTVHGCQTIVARSHDPIEDVDSWLDESESRLTEVFTGSRSVQTVQHVSSLVDDVHEDAMERERRQGSTGLATGFKGLDAKLGGLEPGELIILAGRPSMGKSSLAKEIALTAAEAGAPALIFSLEMPARQWVAGMACSAGSVRADKVRMGGMDPADKIMYRSALDRIGKLPIHVDATPGVTPLQLRGRARRTKARHGLGLIVVDYLQLMRWHERLKSREEEFSEISRSLKELAKELNVPVLALAQVNREPEKRPDKKPILSDLRSSGAIEQDADAVLFIFRKHFYFPVKGDPRSAQLIIAKQRAGATGTVKLTWRGEYTRFEEHDPNGFEDDQRRFAEGGFR